MWRLYVSDNDRAMSIGRKIQTEVFVSQKLREAIRINWPVGDLKYL